MVCTTRVRSTTPAGSGPSSISTAGPITARWTTRSPSWRSWTGKDATGKVGDGVGILTQIPHDFFVRAAADCGITLGGPREYGVGMFFFPTDQLKRTFSMRMFEVIAKKNGLPFLGWRKVPVHPEILGEMARNCMPEIMQCLDHAVLCGDARPL